MATTEWQSITIGQNKEIQKVVSAAAKASDLLNQNVALAKGGLQAAQVFLQGLLNPKILLLTAIADEIDKFVEDLKGTGFFILECANPEDYVIPEDADGNPIKLLMLPQAIAIKMTAAAAAGQTKEFAAWAKEFLGEEDIYLTGAQKAQYEVEQKKKKPKDVATSNVNDNKFAEKDETTGLYKMTPSQMIATMVGAMDDKLDKRRPTFTSSAEAGAVVFIVGISDMTKNLANLKSILDAFMTFFGGDQGLLTGGVKQLQGLVEGVVGDNGWINDVAGNEVKLTVKNVCGVRGTKEDQEKLKQSNIPYNYAKVFEVNDYVVGPRVKFGARCKGWVSAVTETTVDKTDSRYATQTLTITGVTDTDAQAFRTLGSGAKLSRVAFRPKYTRYIDTNGNSTEEGPYNSYEYVEDMSESNFSEYWPTGVNSAKYKDPKKAIVKVSREKGKTELTEVATVDITEEHTQKNFFGGMDNAGKFTTRNTVQGDIFKAVDDTKAPPPNFKAAKLEDLIGEFTTFFASIQMLTDTLRNIAAGSGEALKAIIAFLDSKIKELEEINAALQKILSLFTIGLPNAGVYTLVIPPAVGGNDYIKQELQGAANRPPDDLEFTFGFMMVGGGASTKVLQTLLTAGSA